jgi:hypothetical protein
MLDLLGQQMTIRERQLRYIARHLPKAKTGDSLAIFNVAAAYRILRRPAAAFRWWKRGADLADGSDTLEVGYCYHHGAGVRKDISAAIRSYETAIQSDAVSEAEREEARYLLAVALLPGIGRRPVRARVVELLRRANKDDDYPQSGRLLASLESIPARICTCRHGLRFGLARLHCPVHRKRRAQKSRSGRQTALRRTRGS